MKCCMFIKYEATVFWSKSLHTRTLLCVFKNRKSRYASMVMRRSSNVGGALKSSLEKEILN